MSAGYDRRRSGFGFRGSFCGASGNRATTPPTMIEVWHVGKCDYITVVVGVGVHSRHDSAGQAHGRTCWFAELPKGDLDRTLDALRTQATATESGKAREVEG